MEIKLDLTVQEVNLILAGIAELPIKLGTEIYNKVKTQAEAQIAPAQPSVPTTTKD